MVIKGKSVGHATNLARYLERDPKNLSVEVVEIRGAAAKDLQGALQEWALTAAGTRCEKPLYSASINPQQHEKLTREQYLRAADILEEKLGLTGQPRALIIQVNDKGREHYRNHPRLATGRITPWNHTGAFLANLDRKCLRMLG